MKMTSEEKIESNYAALQAHKAGEEVERFNNGREGWVPAAFPLWFSGDTYRPKPEPVQRPWASPDDVFGAVCWIHLKIASKCAGKLVVHVIPTGVFTYDSYIDFASMEDYEYSTDRKTWRPCTITEDSK